MTVRVHDDPKTQLQYLRIRMLVEKKVLGTYIPETILEAIECIDELFAKSKKLNALGFEIPETLEDIISRDIEHERGGK